MKNSETKIKDTGLGKWLKSKAPNVLDVVGDLLPDQGGLGIVKPSLKKILTSTRKRAQLQ